MARKFKFCIHCRRTISEHEVREGLFVPTKYGMLCVTCAERLGEEAADVSGVAPPPPVASAPPVGPVATTPPVSPAPAVKPPQPVTPAAPAPPPAPVAPVAAKSTAPEITRPATPEAAPEKTDAAAPAERPAEPPVLLLDDIRRHAEAIHRTLVFEKSSAWNVVAAVSQCLAIGVLIIAVLNWMDKPEDLLLVALIFQLMALTFFVRGK